MRIAYFLAATLTAMAGCTNLTSNSANGNSEYGNCDRRNDLNCATNVLAIAETHLGDIYQRVADKEEDESVKRLGISQRNWLKYRDSYVEFINTHAPDAKTSELLSINQRIDMTMARIEELQRNIPQQ